MSLQDVDKRTNLAALSSAWRLFSFERRWLCEVFASVIPGSRDEPLGAFVDDLVATAPLRVIVGARLCLWLLLLSPPFVLGRFTSFFGLDEPERIDLFERLRASPNYVIRELPLLFKMLGALGYCGLPQVHARLGISPRDSEPPSWFPTAKAGDE